MKGKELLERVEKAHEEGIKEITNLIPKPKVKAEIELEATNLAREFGLIQSILFSCLFAPDCEIDDNIASIVEQYERRLAKLSAITSSIISYYKNEYLKKTEEQKGGS